MLSNEVDKTILIVLCAGTPELTEPSEEIRLSLVTLLTSTVSLCGSGMAPYLTDMVTILQRTIVDPYPEVKKVLSCAGVGARLTCYEDCCQ